MTSSYLDPTIPARWLDKLTQNACGGAPARAMLCLAAALLTAGAARGAALDALISAYEKRPTPANRGAVLKYQSGNRDARGGMAALALGYVDLGQKRYGDAAAALEKAQGRVKPLEDYVAFGLASAAYGRLDYGQTVKALALVYALRPESSLTGAAAALEARAWLALGDTAKALSIVEKYGPSITDAEREAILGTGRRKQGRLPQAVAHYQKVYYDFPTSAQAPEAAQALAELRLALGKAYPPPMPGALLRRANRWYEAADFTRAREEFIKLTEELGGAEREMARVRLAASSFKLGRTLPAYNYLKPLALKSPEADAERLYYLAAASRRLNRTSEMLSWVKQLSAKYPQSPWRLEALTDAGNVYLLQNDYEQYEKHYGACHEAFSGKDKAAYCHWWVAWSRYLRKPGAEKLIEEHIRIYPGSQKIPAALYFLGRAAERKKDYAAARTYYEALKQGYASYYYAALARERLLEPELVQAAGSPSVARLLEGVRREPAFQPTTFEPGPELASRLERYRLLDESGLASWAEKELQFAARASGDSHIASVELASRLSKQGNYQRSLRQMKRMNPGYQSLALDAAPRQFWELLYPLPYRQQIEAEARRQGLDPHLVAGLIRQESEFNATAVSRASARGLIQIMPATGRMLSRNLGIRNYSLNLLFRPEISIRMGTYYLRSLLDQTNGRLEMALASYNAGKSRADAWINWADYREPAEFVETIPFSETRGYIQLVLGNAAIYRSLYGEGGSAIMASNDLRERKVFRWDCCD